MKSDFILNVDISSSKKLSTEEFEFFKEEMESNFPFNEFFLILLENSELEKVVDQLEQERFDRISGKNVKPRWTVEEINKAKAELLTQNGTTTCTIADLMSKLK
jgi:hypothetical protein